MCVCLHVFSPCECMGWFSTTANGDGPKLSHQTGLVLPPMSQSAQAMGHHCSNETPTSTYLHARPAHSILEAKDCWPQQPFLLLGTPAPRQRGPVVTGAIHQLWVFVPEWEITVCHCFCYTNHCKRLSGTGPLLSHILPISINKPFLQDSHLGFLSYSCIFPKPSMSCTPSQAVQGVK